MEEKVESAGVSCIRVILTGPESTGKTELASVLAKKYNTVYIPEYARDYIEKLERPYNYADIEHIAKHQLKQMEDFSARGFKVIFVDTYLLITKIWFDWVYKRCPEWLEPELLKTKNDLYLLCKPDIPWYPDNVRENGGEIRDELFDKYENKLKHLEMHFKYVSGIGEERIKNACEQIKTFFLEKGIKFLPDE